MKKKSLLFIPIALGLFLCPISVISNTHTPAVVQATETNTSPEASYFDGLVSQINEYYPSITSENYADAEEPVTDAISAYKSIISYEERTARKSAYDDLIDKNNQIQAYYLADLIDILPTADQINRQVYEDEDTSSLIFTAVESYANLDQKYRYILGDSRITKLTQICIVMDCYTHVDELCTALKMGKETPGQCVSAYPKAKQKFQELSAGEKDIFVNEYSEAYERLKKWAAHHGEIIDDNTHEFISAPYLLEPQTQSETGLTIGITVGSIVLLIGIVVIVRIKKNKKDNYLSK